MKKIITLLSLSALLLGACQVEESDPEETTVEETEVLEEESVESESEAETSSEASEESEPLEQEVDDVIEPENQNQTLVSEVEDINEIEINGPFEVTLLSSRLGQVQPAEDRVELYGGEDLAVVTFNLEITNTDSETRTLYPNQGLLMTDQGDEIEANLFISDEVGGSFAGEETKSGEVIFMYEGDAEEVSSVRYIIQSAHDENFNDFGESLEFTVNFE